MGNLAKLAEAVQEVLGTHQDGVVAQERLITEAETARRRVRTPSRTACSSASNAATAQRAHEEFPGVWAETCAGGAELL